MMLPQRPLEGRPLHWQGRAVAGMEGAERMGRRQGGAERRVAQGLPLGTAGLELGLQYLALGELRIDVEQRPGEHVQQAPEGFAEQIGRHLEEEVGMPLAGRGVEPAAAAPDEGHEAPCLRIGAAAEK